MKSRSLEALVRLERRHLRGIYHHSPVILSRDNICQRYVDRFRNDGNGGESIGRIDSARFGRPECRSRP